MNPRDARYIKLALQLAEKGRPFVSPNPMVGAVVVKEGKIVGKGYHARVGEDHAEVVALREAGEHAKGATLYINLEPCTFQGRTPPCVDRIIEAGIKRVVVSMIDPNPLVSGRGVEKLRQAGLEVEVGVLEEQAKQLNEVFIKYVTQKLPFVTAKIASSLDGKIATKSGDSQWISGEQGRLYAHILRSRADAVCVGIGTVLKDDPLLTVRFEEFGWKEEFRPPARVVIDSMAKIPQECALLKTARDFKTYIITTGLAPKDKIKRIKDAGAEVIVAADDWLKVDLVDGFRKLAEREIASVLIEGGGNLVGAAFDKKLVDKIVFIYGAKIIGGADAPTICEGEGAEKLDEAIKVERLSVKLMGEDIVVEGYPVYCEG